MSISQSGSSWMSRLTMKVSSLNATVRIRCTLTRLLTHEKSDSDVRLFLGRDCPSYISQRHVQGWRAHPEGGYPRFGNESSHL
jgi:hypothetical protein